MGGALWLGPSWEIFTCVHKEWGGRPVEGGNYENSKTVHILLKAVLENSSM